jgi:hypothetical protein
MNERLPRITPLPEREGIFRLLLNLSDALRLVRPHSRAAKARSIDPDLLPSKDWDARGG